jgi:hypothetical protein
VSVDLSGLGIECPDSGCIVALLAEGSSFVDGAFEIRDSANAGPFDTAYNDSASNSGAFARAGVRIEAVPVGTGTPVPALGGLGLAVLAGGLVVGGGVALNRRRES